MKKIKKILPLLLGVMVLMFGTLTVSAATLDTSAVTSAIEQEQFTTYKYRCMYTDGSKYYYATSDNPINVVLQWHNGAGYTTYGFLEVKGNYAVYSMDLDISNISRKYYGKLDEYQHNMISQLYASSGKQDVSNLKSMFVASNFDMQYRILNTRGGSSNQDFGEYTDFFYITDSPITSAIMGIPETVQSQTKVILTIAVACLTLLVILLVLPKKLPRFLNR